MILEARGRTPETETTIETFQHLARYWELNTRFLEASIHVLCLESDLENSDQEIDTREIEGVVKRRMHAEWLEDLHLNPKNCNPDGTLAMRLRKTTDLAWVEKNLKGKKDPARNLEMENSIRIKFDAEGKKVLEFDTARVTNFDVLPRDWQEKNETVASAAVSLAVRFLGMVRARQVLPDERAFWQMGKLVHGEWIKGELAALREIEPALAVEFEMLTQEMQNKDLLPILIAVEEVAIYLMLGGETYESRK